MKDRPSTQLEHRSCMPNPAQVNLEGDPAAAGISQALLFPGCAEMNPIEYVNGLAKAFTEKYGGKIYEQSRVTKIEGKKVRTSLCCWARGCA